MTESVASDRLRGTPQSSYRSPAGFARTIARTGALASLLLIASCATSDDTSPEIRLSSHVDLTPEQLIVLRRTISATGFQADWVDVERHPAQIVEAGHDTVLLAEAVKAPRMVESSLCVGELLPLRMSGSGFDRNLWNPSVVQQYAVYQPDAINPCAHGRHREARIRVTGQVKHDELLAVLQAFSPQSADSGSSSFEGVHLSADERIVGVIRRASAEGLVIEVMTSTGEGRGRRFHFREQSGAWVGRVVGGWIS